MKEQQTNVLTEKEKALIAEAKKNNPSFMKIVWREIKGDKVALISLILLVLILGIAYASPLFIDQVQAKRVDVFNVYLHLQPITG